VLTINGVYFSKKPGVYTFKIEHLLQSGH